MRGRRVENLAATFQGLKADYAGAKVSRFRRTRTGVSWGGSGADYHYRSEGDYLRLMEFARDMDRNDVLVSQLVDRAVNVTVQDGIQVDPMTSDAGVNAELKARWVSWGEDPDACDVKGEQSWGDMEWTCFRAMLVDGDICALPMAEGQLELVEAHRLRTPNNTKRDVVHGVLLDEYRKRVEYWFTRDEIDPMRPVTKVGDMERIAARDGAGRRQVFHIYNPRRASQTRGVTAFAPIFDASGQLEDILFAKLVQQQIVSCFAILRTRQLDADQAPPAAMGAVGTELLNDGTTRALSGIAPGMEVTGAPGEELQGFSPSVPNAEFFPHARLTIQLIGINLGLPLAAVLLDGSETNFSGWRGAVDLAKIGWRRNQRAGVSKLHRPVYLWKCRQWAAEDAALGRALAKDEQDFFTHRWNVPVWPYIEPLKDASADLLRVRNGLISPRRVHAERGRDWDDIYLETCEDNGKAIRRAKLEASAINAEFPEDEPVHWREVLSLPTPDGVSVAVGADGGGADGSQSTARPTGRA